MTLFSNLMSGNNVIPGCTIHHVLKYGFIIFRYSEESISTLICSIFPSKFKAYGLGESFSIQKFTRNLITL